MTVLIILVLITAILFYQFFKQKKIPGQQKKVAVAEEKVIVKKRAVGALYLNPWLQFLFLITLYVIFLAILKRCWPDTYDSLRASWLFWIVTGAVLVVIIMNTLFKGKFILAEVRRIAITVFFFIGLYLFISWVAATRKSQTDRLEQLRTAQEESQNNEVQSEIVIQLPERFPAPTEEYPSSGEGYATETEPLKMTLYPGYCDVNVQGPGKYVFAEDPRIFLYDTIPESMECQVKFRQLLPGKYQFYATKGRSYAKWRQSK